MKKWGSSKDPAILLYPPTPVLLDQTLGLCPPINLYPSPSLSSTPHSPPIKMKTFLLGVKCEMSPYAHVFEKLVVLLGRLWKLWDMGQGW